MISSIRFCVFYITSLSLILSCSHKTELYSDNLNKLDPVFHESLVQDLNAEDPSAAQQHLTPVSYNEKGEPVYAVVIHTSNADTLIKTGINIQTTFREYATARLTIREMLHLLEMDDVHYIESSKMDNPDTDKGK